VTRCARRASQASDSGTAASARKRRMRRMVAVVDVRDIVVPIQSPIRNAYIDFSKMNVSIVAIVTDVIREGHPLRKRLPSEVREHAADM
jgi:hypothetical protein